MGLSSGKDCPAILWHFKGDSARFPDKKTEELYAKLELTARRQGADVLKWCVGSPGKTYGERKKMPGAACSAPT